MNSPDLRTDMISAIKERDELKREYIRVCEAAVELLGRLKGMVATGQMKTLPEMEALEIALTLPKDMSTSWI